MAVLTGEHLQALLESLLISKNEADANRALQRHKGKDEIHFKNIDWQKLRSLSEDGSLNFPEMNWGGHKLVFEGCSFGHGDFHLSGTFNGQVEFHDVMFGEGNVSFAGSRFQGLKLEQIYCTGRGEFSFAGAWFARETIIHFGNLGNKNLVFEPADVDDRTTNKGETLIGGDLFMLTVEDWHGEKLTLRSAQISSTGVVMNFGGATNLKTVDFTSTLWTSQSVYVDSIEMNNEDDQRLAFTLASFEKVHHLFLRDVGMTKGSMIFAFAKFPSKALFNLQFADLGTGQIAFHHASFPGSVEITQKGGANFASELSFKGSTFEGPLTVAGMTFGPVPDFTRTEFSKHLNLSNVAFGAQLTKKQKRSEVNRDVKLQRIKALAEDNRDHDLALMCHAEEMKYNRFRKNGLFPWCASILDAVYQGVSDYGRSIFLPVLWLVVTWLCFGGIYLWQFDNLEKPWLFSAGWLLPFLPVSGVLRTVEYAEVFKSADPSLYSLIGLQSLIAIPLLFLVGLGFRNRFRI
ncbi:MAG: hypothetical protein JKY47_15235 [Thalassospira sp.]|nr:hypothetical protein [Thalassospira sp.]